MEKNLMIDYLPTDLVYKLQDSTGIQIMYDKYIDKKALSEAIREFIWRS